MKGELRDRPRVLIVGGGIAGLEAAMALADLAGDRAALSLISPEPDFVLKPLVVEEPFTSQPPEQHELEPLLAEFGVDLVRGSLRRVDPEARELELEDGSRLGYGHAVICVGSRPRPAFSAAETFWADRGDLEVDRLLGAAANSPSQTLALIAPPETSWPLPLYEVALMLRRRSEELGLAHTALRLITPEDAPLAIFGSAASGSVAELLRARHIDFHGSTRIEEGAGGRLIGHPGGVEVEAGAMIALPVLDGPRVAGLPSDDHGFITIDERCRVAGCDHVYAAGDGTSFPVKQGGLATQQADCAAEQIAAELGAPVEPGPFHPILRGQLLTGMESLHMRHALSGGEGEGFASLDRLWWPPHKVAGRYLSAWLAEVAPRPVPEPVGTPLEVEVAWPSEWHAEPVSYDAERPG